MMIGELSQRIWSHEQFHREAGELRSHVLRRRYVQHTPLAFDGDALHRLLRSAAVLAASSDKIHRELAYQIAIAASELHTDDLEGIPYVLLLVLSRLGNFPALSYAKRRFSIIEDRLPIRVVPKQARDPRQTPFDLAISLLL
jgi:hypothetical protein